MESFPDMGWKKILYFFVTIGIVIFTVYEKIFMIIIFIQMPGSIFLSVTYTAFLSLHTYSSFESVRATGIRRRCIRSERSCR